MKLIARSDGVIRTTVRPKIATIRRGLMPSKSAASAPPAKTAVPGRASRFRSAIASSGVGEFTTGGTRRTA